MTERIEHRWAVDSLSESMAQVEEDGERMIVVPRYLLPEAVTERQLLRVCREPGSDASAIIVTISIDEAETARVMAKSKRKTDEILASSLKNDAGGDVAL